MEKVIRDGMVAVLHTPDYGGGWFTWNINNPECLFDPAIVAWVEGKGELPDLKKKYGSDFYTGSVEKLEICWVPVGEEFVVEEYDGWESVTLKDDMDWIVA